MRIQRRSNAYRRLARLERQSRRRPGDLKWLLFANAAALGYGYLAAEWTGLVVAVASAAACSFLGATPTVLAGIAMIAAGAGATLAERELVRSIFFATDRPTAARLVMLGVVIIVTSTARQIVVERDRRPVSGPMVESGPRTQRAPTSASFGPRTARLKVLAEFEAVGAVSLGVWLTIGPKARSGDLDRAIRRLDDGAALVNVVRGLDSDVQAAVLPVAAGAYGPLPAELLAAVLLALGAAGTWATCRMARWCLPPAGAPLLIGVTLMAGAWPRGDLGDPMAIGLVTLAVAGMMTKTPAGLILGGLLLGLATLARPEVVLAVPLVFFIGLDIDTRQGLVPAASVAIYACVVGPWWRWRWTNLDQGPMETVDLWTTARVLAPVVALYAALAAARPPPRSEEFGSCPALSGADGRGSIRPGRVE